MHKKFHKRVGWDRQEAGRGHRGDSWSDLAKGIFCTMKHHAQQQHLCKGGKEECFKLVIAQTGRALLLEWDVVSGSLCITWGFSTLSFTCLNCLYLNPQVSSFLPFLFCPLSTRKGGVGRNKRHCGHPPFGWGQYTT